MTLPHTTSDDKQGRGPIKQVIVMRTDLGIRKGKMISQGAHSSMVFMSEAIRRSTNLNEPVKITAVQQAWLDGLFTKICARVDSEAQLQSIIDQACAAGLVCHTIIDSGATEFHGVPTMTCCALGPDYADRIDPITGHLKLL